MTAQLAGLVWHAVGATWQLQSQASLLQEGGVRHIAVAAGIREHRQWISQVQAACV